MRKFIPKDFSVSVLPKRDRGVRPTNSLKVSLNGSLLGSVIMPSLIPLIGSLINVKVMIESNMPGRPTPMKAACQPFRPKGACDGSGKAEFQVSKIAPPRNNPIPAPRYNPLEYIDNTVALTLGEK